MKNILVIIESLKAWWWAEKIASSLWTELNKKWYNVHFLTFYDFPKEELYSFKGKYFSLKQKKITEKDWFFKKIKTLLLDRSKEIAKYCKKNNIDTCVSFMEAANFVNILSKNFWNKSKIIISVHQDPNIYWKLYKFLIKKLYNKADITVSITKVMEKTLENNFNLRNLKTIYNLHNINLLLEKQNEIIEEEYHSIFNWNWFIFSTIWRLTEPKWQWYLIRSFKRVIEKYPDSKLIIIWEWELRNKLEKLIKDLKLENNIFLLWLQNNPIKFIKKSDCFVFSSLWEWFWIVLIEALTCNIPIISTDCQTWPREILAPELDINKKINYPYYWKYWILIKTPKKEFIWDDLEKKELTKEEKILANSMIEIIENKNLEKKYSNWLERAFDFDNEKIIREWDKII